MAKTKTKHKRMTKRQLTMQRHRMWVMESFLAILAVGVVFFNFVMILKGGWDDLNHTLLFFAPLLAMGALVFSILDVKRYSADGARVVAPLVIVAVSSAFYLIVSLVEMIIVLGKL